MGAYILTLLEVFKLSDHFHAVRSWHDRLVFLFGGGGGGGGCLGKVRMDVPLL